MDQISQEDRLILKLLERLTRVETKLDTLMDTLERSNAKFISIDDSLKEITGRVAKVEYEANRANLRLDDSKSMVVKIGTITSTCIGLLINALGLYLSHK